MVTKKKLASLAKVLLNGKKFIVALNSEPYVHNKTLHGVKVSRGSGGAQNLLDPLLQLTGGSMVSVASGSADDQAVDKKGRVLVPPDKKKYTLRRIFLTKDELENYYNGFSNQTLWPLSHLSFVKPKFEHLWWKTYKRVNQKFTDAIVDEAKNSEALVWVNDYQLCLVPSLLKKIRPSLKVGVFWHIPWPTKEIFSICPWRKDILEGLTAADFIGFHHEQYVKNFMDCTAREMGVSVFPTDSSIHHNNHLTQLGSLPAGVDYSEITEDIANIPSNQDAVKDDFNINYEKLIIGVDRIDHTKGLVERLYILDMFFDKYPEHRGKVTHLMIGAPSRTYIPRYHKLTSDVSDMVERINWKYSLPGWQPILFINNSIPREKIFAYYRCADVCLVTSLEDGMNLVAKEYAICAQENKGVLMLSKFAGAARELSDAILINPYDTVETTRQLHMALTLPKSVKIQVNKKMKKILQVNNIYKWGKEFITATLNGEETA